MTKATAPAILIALTLLTACTPTATESPTPTTASSSAAVTPSASPTSVSASPTPTSTLDPDQEAAQAAVVEYFRALNAVRSDPEEDFQQVADITTGSYTSALSEVVNNYRSIGAVQVGESTYTYGNVGPVTETEDVRSVEVQVCSDSTNSDMVDANGDSVLDPDRGRFVETLFDVIEVNNGWRINGGQSEEVESC